MLKDLDRVLANVGDGVVALDKDLRYIFANDAAIQMVGLSRDQVLGRTPEELFPPEVSQRTMPHMRAAMASLQPVHYEAYYPDGDRWFENRLYPSPEGVTIFFTDVTARKRAEHAIRTSEEATRLLISLTDSVRGLSDPDAVIYRFIQQVGRHFRVSRCTYGEIDAIQEHVIVNRDYTDGVISVAGRHRLEAFGPALIHELKAGRTVVVDDVRADPRTNSDEAMASFAAIETRSLLCVPLVKDGRFAAVFVLHHVEPRSWTAADVALMEQIAERTWFAVATARTEHALRESRDVLSLAMRAGRMGAWARNLVTNEVWWSHELEEIFGLPGGTFEGTEAGFFQFVHEDDRAAVEAAVAHAIETRTDYDVEFRIRHASGEWRWMEGRGRASYAEDGTPRSLYGLGIDITGRKRDEHALAAARDAADADAQRLALALAAARLGDWSYDPATDVVTMSERAAEIFGIPPGPHMTWTEMRELLHPDDREKTRLAVEEALAHRTNYSIEYRVMSDGRERWVFASGRGRYGDGGSVLGMLGVVQDITTDRLLVRLDDSVRPLRDPEEITFKAATLLGEHLDVNRCAYAVVEEDQNSFVLTGNYTRGAHSIVGRYTFRQFGTECLRLMRAGQPFVVSDSASDPRIDDTDRLAYEATAIRAVICVPILKAGRFAAAMAVHTTAPRQWERSEVHLLQQVASRCWESLERARVERERTGLLEAAEGANRAKDEFLAMLGHELRNPLSPILTALQLMKLRADDSSSRERTVIERQVLHLTRLVDDLLDVSRIARGKVALKTEVVEIADIVGRAIEVASPLLETRAHTLTVDVPRTGLAVDGDVARLSQVVSNLLTNAAKYTQPGGRISVAAAMADRQIVLRIKDSGIGIAPDVLPFVFDLFVQGRQAIDRAEGGLGLGLTIARSLVERHGGTVTAHSDGLDRGSEFVVRLPVADVQQSVAPFAGAAGTAAPAGQNRARILVVDDNVDAAEMLAEVLKLCGYETRTAHDGAEALRICAHERFDAAFLDIGLPVMDGYELAGRLRQLGTMAGAPLIAVTGYGQESDRRRAAAAGFDHHLVKPVAFDRLDAVLAEIGTQRRGASG